MRAMLAPLLLFGCTIDSTTFLAELPAGVCDRVEECVDIEIDSDRRPGSGAGSADTAQALRDACVTEYTDALEVLDSDAACEYNPRQGAQCLAAVTEGTCEERTAIYYECIAVYTGGEDSYCALDLSGAL